MKKRYADGSELEGEPEDIARLEALQRPVSVPTMWTTPSSWPYVWPPVTVTYTPVGEECAIQRYLRNHPGEAAEWLVCYCSKCRPNYLFSTTFTTLSNRR